MPQIDQLPLFSPQAAISGWQISESRETLGGLCNSIPPESLNEKLQKEWLVKNILARKVLNPGVTVRSEPSGKPITSDGTHISFTHSADRLFVAASRQPVGIDLQYYTDKLLRVAGKFVSDEEYALIAASGQEEPHWIHFLWSAKEAVYKIYGERIAFKDIVCKSPRLKNEGIAGFMVEGKDQRTVQYTFFETYCFCLAL